MAGSGRGRGRRPPGDVGGDRARQPVLRAPQHRLHVRGLAEPDGLGNRRPGFGVLGEASGDQLCQPLRDPAEVGLLMDDPVEHTVRGPLAESRRPRRRVRGDLTEGEDVGGRGHPAPRGLFGGHERRRADGDAAAGERGRVGGVGDTEIDDTGPVGGEQHIGRLEIAVHDARAMDDVQGLGHARDQQQHRLDRQRPMGDNRVGQRGPRHVRGGQPGLRAVGVGVDDGCCEQALHPLRGLHFLGEPAAELGVLPELGADHLDGHGPPTGRVRQIHLAHAARAELGGQPVSADGCRIVSRKRLKDRRRTPPVRLLSIHELTSPPKNATIDTAPYPRTTRRRPLRRTCRSPAAQAPVQRTSPPRSSPFPHRLGGLPPARRAATAAGRRRRPRRRLPEPLRRVSACPPSRP